MSETNSRKYIALFFFLIWFLLIGWAFIYQYETYIAGITIGVLTGVLNFLSLVSSVERKKDIETMPLMARRYSLTSHFFGRYALLAVLLFGLSALGNDHVLGFLLGFASLYSVLFIQYIVRLVRRAKGDV